MNRTECLKVAEEIVTCDKDNTYGSPEDNFKLIARFWSHYMGCNIESIDVANMMILLKVVRAVAGKFNADNYIDIAGYAAYACEIGDRGDK